MLGSRLSLLGHSIDWPLSVWLEAQGKCNKHRNETVVEQILFFPSISSPTEQSAYSQNSSGNATRESTAMRDGALDESRRWKLHLLARLLIWSKITRYGNKTASEYSSILSRR